MNPSSSQKAAVSLVFDDGYKEVYEHVLPLLERFHFPAVFAIPAEHPASGVIDGGAVLPLATWKHVCVEKGHELAAHGRTHINLTTCTPEELVHNVEACKKATGATTLVYPGGAYNTDVRATTARFFSAARTTLWGYETLPPNDPYTLHTFNATRTNFSLWKWHLRLRVASIRKRWCIETFHRITDDPKVRHGVSLKDLERHCMFLKRLSVQVVTIREMIEQERHG